MIFYNLSSIILNIHFSIIHKQSDKLFRKNISLTIILFQDATIK